MIIKGSLVNPDDGDLKLSVDLSGQTSVKEYSTEAEKWLFSSFHIGSASLQAGNQVFVMDSGNTLAYRLARDAEEFRLLPFYAYGTGGTIRPLSAMRMYGTPNLDLPFHDGTIDYPAPLVDGVYEHEVPNTYTANFMTWMLTHTLGSVVPTSPLQIRVYVNTRTEDNLLLDMILPVSLFDGKTTGDDFSYYFSEYYGGPKTPLGGEGGKTYITVMGSESPWAIKGDATQPYGEVRGQLFAFDRLVTDNTVEVSGAVTHEALSTYIVDTSGGECEITIPYGIESPFTVRDQEKTFNVGGHACKIYIKDSGGSTVHSATLNSYNKSYHIYFDGTDWNYSIEGEGETVAIASDHVSAVDFPYEPRLVAIDKTASEENVGKVRYRTTSNSSCMEMCMQTGATTYAWECFHNNTW